MGRRIRASGCRRCVPGVRIQEGPGASGVRSRTVCVSDSRKVSACGLLSVAEDEVELKEYLRRKRSSRIERQRTFTNETIREAVKLWCTDKEAAISRFGHIRDWDTSACTDMHSLFIGQSSFNDDISGFSLLLVARIPRSLCSRCDVCHRWDTSAVTTMCQARTMQKAAYN
jgi:hypothetical protein